jgi:hypothetical protein
MLRRSLIACGASLLILAVSAYAFQWTNEKKTKPRDRTHRDLIGVVTLPDETPANGAVVQLKNMRTLQVRSFITQKDGKYMFQALPSTVDYEVRAVYKNLASPTRSLSIFDTRLDPVINLRLEPKKPAESPTNMRLRQRVQ